jgi:integrase
MKGHIKERYPGSWAIVLDVRDPATGKRRRRWHTHRGTKREAQKECARLIAELETGAVVTEPSRLTVGAFLEQWLQHIKPAVSASTHERYTLLARKSIAPLLGEAKLTKLTPLAISRAYAQALASGRSDGKGGLSPRSVLHMHRLLKQSLAQAVRWGMIARNPVDAVDAPRMRQRQLETYDIASTATLLDAVRHTRIFIPTLLAVLCGLRRGEIIALRWRNVDLAKGAIAVVESAEQTKAAVTYKDTKSGRGRSVALSATVIEELKAWRVRQAQELLLVGQRPIGDTFVVTQADGKPVQPRSLSHERVRIIKGTALPRIRFHDLRHAHATHLLASGVHPKIASERLGHSKVGITLDLYSHVMPGMQEDAAARVDDALRVALQRRKPETIG